MENNAILDKAAFARRLRDMADNFEFAEHKANAREELKAAKAMKLSMPHTEFIVEDYPSFSHILLKVSLPDVYEMRICVSPAALRENPMMADALSDMYAYWSSLGAKEVKEGEEPKR